MTEPTYPLKFDLHCHSHYSDGAHDVAYLVNLAQSRGVTHLALTDHDCIEGLGDFDSSRPMHQANLPKLDKLSCAEPLPLTLINGVEISCRWQNLEIHVVGLGIDVEHAGLRALLQLQQQRRRQRIAAIDAKLSQKSIVGLSSYIEKLHCIAPTRSHVAEFLVAKGVCRDRKRAFKSYLAKRGSAYVAAQWSELSEVVAAVKASGGLTVLAHPGRYSLSRNRLKLFLRDFKDAAGDAMEVSYANIQKQDLEHLAQTCLEFDLWASQGSDFHSSEAKWMSLGCAPELPEIVKKNAIWLHPGWHFS